MIAEFTQTERQWALVILGALAVVGLMMAGLGHDDPLGLHGGLVMVAALAGIFAVIGGYYAPEPAADRRDRYYDDPSKIGVVLAMVWAVACCSEETRA